MTTPDTPRRYTLDDVAPALAELADAEILMRTDRLVAVERARLIRKVIADGRVSGVSFYGGNTCVYVLDGTDTNGDEWHHCLTHGATELGPDAPCGSAS